jgi:hypothetical protein
MNILLNTSGGQTNSRPQPDSGQAQLAGLDEITRSFEPYLAQLKDPALGNFKVWTIQTGAAAGIPHVLKHPTGASKYLINSNLPYDSAASNSLVNGTGFQNGAVSELAALSLANAAYFSLMETSLQNHYPEKPLHLLALGLTAATATDRERRGQDHLWLAIRTMEGSYTAHIDLGKGQGQESRTRQDNYCNILGINAILCAAGLNQLPILDDKLKSEELIVSPTGKGKILQLKKTSVDPRLFAGAGPFVFNSAGELVAQQTEAESVIDSDSILFPDSFETLHFGHRAAAIAAQAADLSLQEDSIPRAREVIFEICADNFDPLKAHTPDNELARRVDQHRGANAVVVTRGMPLFIQKLALFKNVKRVVLGYDTAERLTDPRRYPGGDPERNAILESFIERGMLFYVTGRYDQQGFKTAKNLNLPDKYKDLFIGLPGRMKISSTELRQIKDYNNKFRGQGR